MHSSQCFAITFLQNNLYSCHNTFDYVASLRSLEWLRCIFLISHVVMVRILTLPALASSKAKLMKLKALSMSPCK